ncbi:MAG: hypothetical protein IIA11_03980 [Proteobacteria bacterium]|nr:hypothetical protein [Pseudomonadota bacterium]
MKRHKTKMQHIAALMLGVLLTLGSVVQAEDNTGTGDVAGDSAALVDSNVFQLFSSGALTLYKRAFLTSDGTQLTSGDTLPSGTLVDFMIYTNNSGSIAINDLSIEDVLDPLFVYQAGTIRVDNSQTCAAAICVPGEEPAIYAAAIAAGAGSDAAAAGDTVSFDGTDTINVGNAVEAANDQQDAVASSVLAVVFTVQVQ